MPVQEHKSFARSWRLSRAYVDLDDFLKNAETIASAAGLQLAKLTVHGIGWKSVDDQPFQKTVQEIQGKRSDEIQRVTISFTIGSSCQAELHLDVGLRQVTATITGAGVNTNAWNKFFGPVREHLPEESLSPLPEKESIELRRRLEEERDRSAEWDELLDAAKKELPTIKKELEQLKSLYNVQLGLEAPVKYWNDRATEHGRRKDSYKRWALRGGGVSFLLLVVGICAWLYWMGAAQPPTWLIVATIASLGLSVWYTRIAVREYLQNGHLQQECESRAVLITTYISLLRAEHVTESDKPLALAAIFAPLDQAALKDAGPLLLPSQTLTEMLRARKGG